MKPAAVAIGALVLCCLVEVGAVAVAFSALAQGWGDAVVVPAVLALAVALVSKRRAHASVD